MFDAIYEKVDDDGRIISNTDKFIIDYIVHYETDFQTVRVGMSKEYLKCDLNIFKKHGKIKSITKIN